jgi:A/G-specific adenine glycosylase
VKPDEVPALRRALLTWFRRAARDLPWRRTRDPYRIWLSEVLLQQTRVRTVPPYYARLVIAFPTVRRLAAAPLEHVLKLWQGLGYYRRAVNLHRAARVIMDQRRGVLPRSAAEWQELPGVGRYTACAIASIAYSEPVPVVDGNVRRVLARLLAVRAPIDGQATQKRLWKLAEMLLARRAPGAFNQALMELGARACTPRRPGCMACPVRGWCAAHLSDTQHDLPVRRRKRPSPLV